MSMTLSVEEVATLLRLSARTVRARLQRGELSGHKAGGQWRLRHCRGRRDATLLACLGRLMAQLASELQPRVDELPGLTAGRPVA
jgi:excisionase family DNA binding protein